MHYIINRKYPMFMHDEDTVQYGMIGLWKACRSFNADIATFSTYASRCICNEVLMELRRRKKYYAYTTVSIYDTASTDPENQLTFADVIPDPEDPFAHVDIVQTLIKVRETLKPLEQQVLDLLMQHKNQIEIADILHVSRSYISRISSDVRRKVADFLGDSLHI